MGLQAIKTAENSLNTPRDLFLFYVKESVRASIKEEKEVLIYLLNNFQSFLFERTSELDTTYFSIFEKSVFGFITYKANRLTKHERYIEVFIPKELLPADIISTIQFEIKEIEKNIKNKLNKSPNNKDITPSAEPFDLFGFDIFSKDLEELETELAEKKDILSGRGLRWHDINFNNGYVEDIKRHTDYRNLDKTEFEIEIKVPKHKFKNDLPPILEAQIGKILSRHAMCYWLEDFIDEDTGEVFSIERSEIVVPKETALTQSHLINIYDKANYTSTKFQYDGKANRMWIYDDLLCNYFNELIDSLHKFGMEYLIAEHSNVFDIREQKNWQIIDRLIYDLIIFDQPDSVELVFKHLLPKFSQLSPEIFYELNGLKNLIIFSIDYLMNEFRDEIVHCIIETLNDKLAKNNRGQLEYYFKMIAYIFIKYYHDEGLLILSGKYGLLESELAELKFIYMVNEDDYRYIDNYVFNIN